MSKQRIHLRSRIRGVALALALTALVGCDDFMRVTNPGAIDPGSLNDPSYIALMVNGVIGDFQPAYAWTAMWSGVFTDELRNHHAYFENIEIGRRAIGETNGTYQLSVYNGLHRARFLADSVTTRLQQVYGDTASYQLPIARTLTLAGYSWTMLGEQYCETPINRSAAVRWDELLRTAVGRFESAMPYAEAARTAGQASNRPAIVAGADSLLNLARIGAARAALGVSNDAAYRAKALQYARAVEPAYTSPEDEGFQFNIFFAADADRHTRRVSSPYYEFIRSGRWFSITDTKFEGLNDPRVPHSDTLYTAADGTQRTFPNAPSAFGAYDATLSGGPFDIADTQRLGSALEARYIIAELEGMTPENILFVNERRAVGGQGVAVITNEEEYMAELREQRARDLYLDGHRMGDIRRYKELYGLDLWPRGSYFGSTTLEFGPQECWPIPVSETY